EPSDDPEKIAEPAVEQDVASRGSANDGPSVRNPAEPAAGVAGSSPPPAGPVAASEAVPSDQATAGRSLVDATAIAPEEGCPGEVAGERLRLTLEAIYGTGRADCGPSAAAPLTPARPQPLDRADPAQGGAGRGPP